MSNELPILFGSHRVSYIQKVLGIQPNDLILYHPMNEPSGSVANDYSPESNNGVYTGVTLGQPGVGDGDTCPFFDGANDFNNIYSVAFNADFDGGEGTIASWFKVNAAGVWTDSAYRDAVILYADGNNQIRMYKGSTNNQFNFIYKAGGTQELISRTISPTAWTHVALTWSRSAGANGEMKVYISGLQVDSTQTSLGTWAGNLLDGWTLVGANRDTVANPWHGWMAHALVSKVALSASQIADLAAV